MKRTILITGASSGIGRSTAKLFQSKDWNVMATMRSPDKCTELVDAPNLKRTALDVTDSASISRAIEEAVEKFGGIDTVVNNAGYGLVGPFEATDAEHIERQFATNVFGLMNVTRAIIPFFRKQNHGQIINVASVGGRVTFPLYSCYHATKWAVEGFSESLQFELKPFNIKVKIIEPGPIKTDFYDRSMDLVSKPSLTAYDTFVAKAMPRMQNAGARAPGPDLVAKVIYTAATDNTWKLRYQANSQLLLALRKLLPDAAIQAITVHAILR